MQDQPFGTRITAQAIVEDLSFFDQWEDRYRYLIDLGKQLPVMDAELKTEDRKVRGCQSQVWIQPQQQAGRFYFDVDSDALIVKGLLGLVMSAYNGKTAAEIQQFDIEGFFESLDLIRHLTPARGNGLRAMVEKIRSLASAG
jgi:cysteine desulfuration protein SufE